MKNLLELNNKLQTNECSICKIKKENDKYGIPMCRITQKENPEIIFVGRDPNPWSNKGIIGDLSNQSPNFHQEIVDILKRAQVSEEKVYITNLLKCHWYCDGNKIKELKYRKKITIPLLQPNFNNCSSWFRGEIRIIQPKLIVSFGEDNLIYFKDKIIQPNIDIEKFKEVEQWQINNGIMKVKINDKEYPLVILRHPGGLRVKDTIWYKNNEKVKNILIDFMKEL